MLHFMRVIADGFAPVPCSGNGFPRSVFQTKPAKKTAKTV